MSGITSNVGLFSGINTAQIIDQLMTLEARPKTQLQSRIMQLQLQNAGYLDINTRLSALKTAAANFRTNKTFQSKAGTSSNENVLKATVSSTASPGTYQFLVDRLVSSQQNLSRGFASRDATAIGVTSITVESAEARLDRDVSLSDLNDGQGVRRGKMILTDSQGNAATVDLSRATSVQEVLDAINGNGSAQVTATISGGKFVITDTAGGNVTVANAVGSNAATDLGLAGVTSSGGKITGSTVYALNRATSLNALNDGRGVSIRNIVGDGAYNFSINIDGASPAVARVNLGELWQTVDGTLTKTAGPVSSVGEAVDRINAAITASGATNVTAQINTASGRLEIIDATGDQSVTVTENAGNTARDLGLLASPDSGSIIGNRVFSGLNTTLISGINGGKGLGGDGLLTFTARDGTVFSTSISAQATLSEVAEQIETASRAGGGPQRLRVSLNNEGTGLRVTDITGATTSNLIIGGTNGNDTAASLGISTGPSGVASNSVTGANLQRQYIAGATLVSSLNQGRGIGTGTFRITDASSRSVVIDIASDTKTVDDLLREINATDIGVTARINANGDGIEIVERDTNNPGTSKIKIEDVSGGVAKNLNIAGQASGTGASNSINGSYERVIATTSADTLETLVSKINGSKAGVSASIIRDGTGTTPFRLSLSSNSTGVAGRVIISSLGGDLGLTTLDAGNDARVFFGSADPAKALVVGGSTNSLDNVINGVKIDLKGVSADPVTLSITSDTGAIEASVGAFVKTFNTIIERIDFQTSYNADTKKASPLTGDGTVRELRSALFNAVTAPAIGSTGTFRRLTDIGIKVATGGRIDLDTEKLRAALAQDPESVEALFTAREIADDTTIQLGDGITTRNTNSGQSFTSLGVAGILERLADRYINSADGVLTRRGTSITDQIKLNNDRISTYDVRLAAKRAVLEAKFTAMEKTIAGLQSQQSALASISKVG